MKAKTKLILLLVVSSFFLTGCINNFLQDEDNKRVVFESTGQGLPSNILCRPTGEELLELYKEHEDQMEFKIEELPRCQDMKLFDSNTYTGLWANLFVKPLAWVIIQVSSLVRNYGIAVMLVGIMIRIVLTPLTVKTMKQSENMKKAQPELERLEKKYKDKKDSESMMQKSQEMMAIYRTHKVSPMSSCIVAFIQLPLFLGFLQAINRTPAIFEETLWTFQLGTTPWIGISNGNYFYIIIILLIIGTTYFAFKYNMNSMGSPQQQQQMKFMMNFMLVFISVASFSLPTAIGLYWIVTNGFSVVQNYIIRKRRKD